MTLDRGWWGSLLANDRDALGDAGEETYLLLPGSSDPRVVVDVASAVALQDAVARMATRSLPLPGIARRLAPLVGRAAGRFGSTWSVEPAPGVLTLRRHLGELLGSDIRLSIAVGPPRPNRKPVVRCFAGTELIAIAKLGPEPHTAALVRTEGEWLSEFDESPLSLALTPRVIHRGTYGKSELLVMSVLPLESDVVGEVDDMPDRVLAELIERTGTTLGLASSEFWRTLESRLSGMADPVVGSAVASIAEDPAASELPLSFWHGDWSPWNVGQSTDGHWCAWDWERASASAPLGFDQLHLHHQYGAGLDVGVGALVDSGRSAADAALVRRLYLLELAARHYEAGEAGSSASDRHRLVLELLAPESHNSRSR